MIIMPKDATHFLYPNESGWSLKIPKYKPHPVKILIKLLNKNSNELNYNVLSPKEIKLLVRFIEEIKKEIRF